MEYSPTEYTPKQIWLLTKLRSCIASVGESCGESSAIHLDLREFQNGLEWYLANRVEEH